MKEMPNLICGKGAVGGNYNSTRDTKRQNYIAMITQHSWMFLTRFELLTQLSHQ